MSNKLNNPFTIDSLISTTNSIIDEKQDVITDLNEIKLGAALGNTAVQPSELENTVNILNNNIAEKQDIIDDLDAIRNGAELGETSIQPSELNTIVENLTTSINEKQDVINDLNVIRAGAELGMTSVQPSDLQTKQDTLISGINIKTINGNSLLGSGNIEIHGSDESGEESGDIPDNYVTLDTDQTITGEKVFITNTITYNNNPALKLANENITKGQNPNTTEYLSVLFEDNTANESINTRLADITYSIDNTGLAKNTFKVYRYNSTSDSAEISIIYPLTGDPYTYAPTPDNSSNNNNIATTAWVKGQGYALSSDIPAAQVNSDWNASSGISQILNKPSLATVATSGNFSDLNGTSEVQITSNLVTSISSSSTDSEYPSAKCVYDIVGDIETLINDIRGI